MDHIRKEALIRIAKAWASIDGKTNDFIRCASDHNEEERLGHYEGYMADAEALMDRAGIVLPDVPRINELRIAWTKLENATNRITNDVERQGVMIQIEELKDAIEAMGIE